MFSVSASVVALALSLAGVASAAADPCSVIGGKTWVLPSEVRACFQAQKVNAAEKNNIIDVVTKTLAFHTSTNYQILAPPPFTLDVHEDAISDLEIIRRTSQANDYDLHILISRAIKRLNDGHVGYINYCYDSLYANYVPTPLAVLYDSKGNQGIYIAPDAFTVATAEFGADAVQFWQDALPGDLKGQLSKLSGAQVLGINGADPWNAVNANTLISGSYQGFGTRQNLFFSTYARSSSWTYSFGQFAAQTLPLSDSVTLKLRLVNETQTRTVTIPYRSRFVSGGIKFTDSKSFRAGNCVAEASTNGASYYDAAAQSITLNQKKKVATPGALERKYPMNAYVDVQPLTDVALPPELQPKAPLEGSTGVAQFHLLDDGVTGVLMLGSFSGLDYEQFHHVLLDGLQGLKSKGAQRLIVDISSNGGGYICVAHWLHRIIAGPKSSTVPQAGLDTKARAGPLARQITAKIAAGGDPDQLMLYNSAAWRFDNNTQMPPNYDWLKDYQKELINLHPDAFSQRLGDECQPFLVDPPAAALFDTKKVVIVGNSRCASSCALFTITMNKEEGVKTVVVGGNRLVPQQYAGIVGGQSTSFTTIDSEIKTVGLKNSTLAPPDFLTNSYQGLTWRLGYGIWDTKEPEEWQNHPATVNLELTPDIVNNPTAIWKKVAKTVF